MISGYINSVPFSVTDCAEYTADVVNYIRWTPSNATGYFKTKTTYYSGGVESTVISRYNLSNYSGYFNLGIYRPNIAFYDCNFTTFETNYRDIPTPQVDSAFGSTFNNCNYLESISCNEMILLRSYLVDNTFIRNINLPLCQSIESGAFMGLSTLEGITLPLFNDPTGDAAETFESCTSLSYAIMPNLGSVAYGLFSDCFNLNSVSLPRCHDIGAFAFRKCSSLTFISLPECSHIGSMAFFGCGLVSANLPECLDIDSHAFYMCTSLLSISLPMCVYLGSSAFRDCTSISYINLPQCTYVGSQAFQSCNNLNMISLPLCSSIGECAFSGCSVTNIYIPQYSRIGVRVFKGWTGSFISLPYVEVVGSFAFENAKMETITIFSCSTIHNNAFQSCTKLTSIYLPSLNYMQEYAFASCYSLEAVILPKCWGIGSRAFWYCSSLSYLLLGNSSVCGNGGDVFYKTPFASGIGSIFVPASLVDEYKAAPHWSSLSSLIYPIQ